MFYVVWTDAVSSNVLIGYQTMKHYQDCLIVLWHTMNHMVYNVDEEDSGLYWYEAINSSGLSRSDDVQLDIFDGNVIGGVVMVVTVLF